MLHPKPVETPDAPPRNDVTGHVERLVESGAPILLSINGQVELRVTNSFAREKLVEMIDRLEYIEKIQESLDAMHRGEPARPIDEFFAEFRREHGQDQQ